MIFGSIRSNFLDNDMSLNLLRENVIQDLLHLHPKLCLFVFQMSCYDIVAFELDVRVTRIAEVAISSAV